MSYIEPRGSLAGITWQRCREMVRENVSLVMSGDHSPGAVLALAGLVDAHLNIEDRDAAERCFFCEKPHVMTVGVAGPLKKGPLRLCAEHEDVIKADLRPGRERP